MEIRTALRSKKRYIDIIKDESLELFNMLVLYYFYQEEFAKLCNYKITEIRMDEEFVKILEKTKHINKSYSNRSKENFWKAVFREPLCIGNTEKIMATNVMVSLKNHGVNDAELDDYSNLRIRELISAFYKRKFKETINDKLHETNQGNHKAKEEVIF